MLWLPQERRPSNRWRFYLIGLLLLLFFLRSYNSLALPGYADESHHIRRAEVAWDFTVNPVASTQPGKLLLYYYLGIFETERVDYLLVSRLAIALLMVLAGAAIYALGRRLFSERIGIMCLLLYALNPFTLFFDRMALADPMAMALLLVSILVLFAWLDHPTLLMGALAGIILILPPLAKLTAAGVAALPFGMVWLYKRDVWRSYVRSGTVMMGIFAIFWLLMFIPTIRGEIRGGDERIVLVNDYLLNIHEDDQSFIENLMDSVRLAFEQTAIYYGAAALALTGIAWGVLFYYQRSREALFLLMAFGIAWLPSIALGSFPRARYLEIGIPFLIIALVGGVYTFFENISDEERSSTILRAVMVSFTLFAIIWGLNFWQPLVTDPTTLPRIPAADRWRYMEAVTAGYGQRDAAAFLESNAEINPETEQVEVYAILGSCHLMRLFLADPGRVKLTCANLEANQQLSAETRTKIETETERLGGMYLLIEPGLASNFEDLALEWEYPLTFARPFEGEPLELWWVQSSP